MEAQLLPTPLSPHPCAARHDPLCWRASTSTTTTRTPTMRTAPPLPGKLSTSLAHSPSISTTLATGQVGEQWDMQTCSHTGTLQYSVMICKSLVYVPWRPGNVVPSMLSYYLIWKVEYCQLQPAWVYKSLPDLSVFRQCRFFCSKFRLHQPGQAGCCEKCKHCERARSLSRLIRQYLYEWRAGIGLGSSAGSCGPQHGLRFSSWCVSLQLSFSGTGWRPAQPIWEHCAAELRRKRDERRKSCVTFSHKQCSQKDAQ